MMVMNFLYFMFSTAVGQCVAMTARVGPSSREMLPSGRAESKVLDRGEGSSSEGGGGGEEIKQQNSRVPICVEALLLYNSDRKSHHGRIIAALSLWVLRALIHDILPRFLSV